MNKKLFIMGAPNAGKSTFLAALWHSINQKDVGTKLTLKRMSGDLNYLHVIEKKWLEVEQLERTVIGQEQDNLSIVLTDGNNDLELEFPDLSGETFQSIYETREMSLQLKEKIYEADAILYFVNVEDIRTSVLISEIPIDYRQGTQIIEKRNAGEDDPTPVQIIDLLQAVLEIKKEIDFGIIFSAWDLVKSEEKNNVKLFLERQMNMLWQYLEANEKTIHTNIWGVSAIGGKLEEADSLLDIDEPIKRIQVVNEKKEISNDLTTIILEMSGEI